MDAEIRRHFPKDPGCNIRSGHHHFPYVPHFPDKEGWDGCNLILDVVAIYVGGKVDAQTVPGEVFFPACANVDLICLFRRQRCVPDS